MFTDVNSFMNLKDCTCSQCFIGISESNCDSSFLIHHFMSYLLKSKRSVVLLSFSQSLAHFNGVGNKIGNNLVSAKSEGQFVFIEGLKSLGQSVTSGLIKGDVSWTGENAKLCIRKLYTNLKSTIHAAYENTGYCPFLLIDNINVLMDVGLSALDVANLLDQLYKSLSAQYGGGLIVGINNDLGEDDEDSNFVRKFMHHMSTMSIEVKGLDTGYCKDVHGQMTVTWCDTTSREKWPRQSSQFKLTDKNCLLFASGMSSAVL